MRATQKHWHLPERENAAAVVHSLLLDGGMKNHLFTVGYSQCDVEITALINGRQRGFRALICSRKCQERVADEILSEWRASCRPKPSPDTASTSPAAL